MEQRNKKALTRPLGREATRNALCETPPLWPPAESARRRMRRAVSGESPALPSARRPKTMLMLTAPSRNHCRGQEGRSRGGLETSPGVGGLPRRESPLLVVSSPGARYLEAATEITTEGVAKRIARHETSPHLGPSRQLRLL